MQSKPVNGPRKSNSAIPHAANSLTAAFAGVRFTTDRASGHPAPASAHAATRAERQAPQWARVQRQGRKGPAPRRAAIGKEIINIDRWAPFFAAARGWHGEVRLLRVGVALWRI